MRTLVSIALVSLLARHAVGADWPQWRGPNFDGTTPESVASTNWSVSPPVLLWSAEVGRGYAGVAVRGERVYTIGNADGRDCVVCLEAGSGAEIWRHTYSAPARAKGTRGNFPGPRATPTVTDEHVYTLSQDGQLKCLSVANGTPVWETTLERDTTQRLREWYGFCGSPLLSAGTLYINHGSRGVLVNALNGELCRPSDGKVSGYAAPQLWRADTAGARLVLFGWNTVRSVDVATGELAWSIPWHTRFDVNAADPVVCPEGIFVTSGYKVGCALLDPESGQIRWRNKAIRAQCSPVVYRDGCIYGFDEYINAGAGFLVCLEAATGREMWRRKGLMGNLILAGDHLLVLTTKGLLMLLQATPEAYTLSGSVAALKGPCWIPPSLAEGRIYCRSNGGRLVCLGFPAAAGQSRADRR